MRKIISFWVAFFCSFLVCSMIYAQTKILQNVHIVDVEKGAILQNMDVYVTDGKIVKICKTDRAAVIQARKSERWQKADVIDLSGKYVMPGLIDAHVHWANFATKRPEMDSLAAAFLRTGVTTVRDMAGDGNVCKRYIQHLQNYDLKGPQLYYCSMWAGEEYFKMMERQGPKMEHSAPWQLMVEDHTNFTEQAKRAKEYGCTGLKLYHDFTKEELTAIVKAAKGEGLHVWDHFATPPASPMDVVLSGAETVSHIYLIEDVPDAKNVSDEKKKNERAAIFNEMKKRGVLLDATLLLSVKNGMKHNIDYVKEAYKCGVELVAGTDYIDITPNGSYTSFILDELDLYANECGIPLKDVLRYATLNGAKALGQEGNLGVIKVGAKADLLILEKNPLEGLETLRNSTIFNVRN
jgi:imidazolonepropionase-like amidohydrolase